MKLFLISILFVQSILINAQDPQFYMPVQTKLQNGKIEGNYDVKSKLSIYLGIPYAQPPVANLRWKAPQPLLNWSGVKQTKKFGARSVQPFMWNDMIFRSEGMSEDCLYLNVWSPGKRNEKNLPVLVYFYGGGFVAGDASEPRYDGASMAQKGIVVVSVNYRLNIFGFFAHPDLSKEAPYKGSGNYGLMDQAAALAWVNKNISAFGGDPHKVTIAGESAGSISVSAQMVSPLSKKYIAGAIGESGAGIPPTLAPIPLKDAEKTGMEFATKAGFKTLSELRALSAKDLLEVYIDSKRFGFPTVIDGYFYPKPLIDIYKEKNQAQVPLLVGWNSAEVGGDAFIPYTSENFVSIVKQQIPEYAEEIASVYPHSTETEVERSAINLNSDRFIVYSTWKWADLHLKYSDKPVYRYIYSKLRPQPTDNINFGPSSTLGAPHACEIEYCLGNLPLVTLWQWDKDDHKVSADMQNYFANFIKTGNPNGHTLPEWKAMQKNATEVPHMVIDVNSKIEISTIESRYKLLDKIFNN